MHLIVVRRDTATYQHLHPRRDSRGTWSIDMRLPEAGVYRAYADFAIGGQRRALATDLFVPGEFEPRPLPEPVTSAAAEGYDVSLEADHLQPGVDTDLNFAVTRAGRPVDEVERYLGARGHLVALREGDLAYLHVHPSAARDDRNTIGFTAQFPSPGRYRLFLQFKHAGAVRNVAYTVEVHP